MGMATKRKKAREAWLNSLDDNEKIIVRIAERLAPMLSAGACYRASFFLKYHLAEHYGITGTAIVGFVNDGTDDVYGSHAWYEYQEKKTDIALWRPLNPSIQRNGPLIIHGHEIYSGWPWTYHRIRPPEGEAFIQSSLANMEHRDFIIGNEELHIRMQTTSENHALIRDYLDCAPDNMGYEVLARCVEQQAH